MTTTTKLNGNDAVYAKITEQLIKSIEAGALPWRRPWANDKYASNGDLLPCNAVTRRPYSGINVFVLWGEASVRGYTTNGWATFNQIKKAGGKVVRGSKGTPVMFMKKLIKKDRDTGEDQTVWLARLFYVFNLDQTEGMEKYLVKLLGTKRYEGEGGEELARVECEEMIKSTGARIKHGGNTAYYNPLDDYIGMPAKRQFKELERYYAVMFHELVHWTGHSSRLDRISHATFGDTTYAMEELVAEMGSAFLCAHFGFVHIDQSAGYLSSWLGKLKESPRFLVQSASAAQRAVSLLNPVMSVVDTEDDAE